MSLSSPPTKKASAAPRASGRSVVDYVTEEELLQALSSVEESSPNGQQRSDWRLPVPDPEAAEQTLVGEFKRLLTLESYHLLDAEKEETFDALTREACRVFGVPTSLISLVDLGRQFLFSNTGNPGDVRETPRSLAFCAHTILNKNGIVVVNDTQCDDRFKKNPLVTKSPFLRFYAGVPLISPEGTKRCFLLFTLGRCRTAISTLASVLQLEKPSHHSLVVCTSSKTSLIMLYRPELGHILCRRPRPASRWFDRTGTGHAQAVRRQGHGTHGGSSQGMATPSDPSPFSHQ